MDDDEEDIDMEDEMLNARILTPNGAASSSSNGSCQSGVMTYTNGEKVYVDCDSICTCTDGKMDCTDRCPNPFVKRGRKIEDPLCTQHPVEDICCATLVCSDTATEALEICSFNNKTFNRGETVKNDCESICYCGPGGKVTCKARCPPTKKVNEKCVEIPHPEDKCCKTVVCDVNAEEHELRGDDDAMDNKILSAKYTNATTIKIDFLLHHSIKPLVDLSSDKRNWTTYALLPDDHLYGIEKMFKYIRMENDEDIIDIQNVPENVENQIGDNYCMYKGSKYEFEQEFNDSCEALCVCRITGVKCFKVECPTYSGTDILDPNCVQWETVPANFTPVPPKCCPDKLECKSHGECEYEGRTYQNWQQIPINVTGCEKRCYCEMGKVECQEVCAPVVATPPNTLPCLPHQAVLAHAPDEDCCLSWICQNGAQGDTSKNVGMDKIAKQKKPFNSKNVTDIEDPLLNKLDSNLPSKTLGPLTIYENHDDNTTSSPEISYKLPNIPPDENHYYSKSKPNKSNKIPQKNVEDSQLNQVPDKFVGQIRPNYPQTNKAARPNPKQPISTKIKAETSTTSAENEENYIPGHVIQSYHPEVYQENKDGATTNGQIHGNETPEELLQLIHQYPQIINYPAGSVVEIHNIPQITQGKPPQYLGPNTITPDQPNVPYIIGDHQQNRPPHISQPPGITFEHILHEITKNTNLPSSSNSFGQNGLLQNNGQLFLPQPVQFNANGQAQRNETKGGFPPGYFSTFHSAHQQEEVIVHTLEALDAHTVKLVFNIPRIIVGLYGRVEVRYTNKDNNDPSTWQLQVFAPPHDLLATPQLEFQLTELKADTNYRIQVTVTLRDMHNIHTSKIYSVRTAKELLTSTLPAMIPIEPDLSVGEVNATWARIQWRPFTPNEMEFIDGVQLMEAVRNAERDGVHRWGPITAVTSYTLENLKYKTSYEVGIFFIPFHDQRTELHADRLVKFTTTDVVDSYGFNVTLEIAQVKSTSVEISWKGVPYPEDKYVNIYRAIYQSDSGKGDFSTFKVAKRDSPSKSIIMDLKSGTRYRLWLEVYLTNGKIKTSNVQDFITKPGAVPVLGASTHDKLSGDISDERGDYYGPLVIVAILATIAILSTLVLLLILIKRHSQNKASITQPARVSQSAYDNPTYKVEIQQETMNL
ncbi:hypothetical protein QE152_g36293 [Popillia japonica]|uniref:Fibronectin type-III domain-containing protein n=1 Tax=Popillia japonica TaxID=7064 RepID=A0AAW1IDM4_POPJA